MGLRNQGALVTGGSRGIGRAIALDLAANGADVAISYRRRVEQATEVVEQIRALGCHALAIRTDVANFQEAERAVRRVLDTFGRLDILINNAGVMWNDLIWEMTEEQWDEVLSINLKGVFNYTRAVASLFRERRSGKIVNIASIHGLRGRPAGPNYSAAKAGVIGLTKSVARDLGPFGVNVNCVAPGVIETEMVKAVPPSVREQFQAEIVLGRLGQPEDVAHVVTFLCTEKARHITGEVIKVDGGQYI
jgi:3-oxoacyl-[acyl-carrier protein] reductase